MNYNRLKSLIAQKNLSIEQAANKIGITAGGFHAMVKNNTMTIKNLESILELVESDITSFFTKNYPTNDNASLLSETQILKIEEMKELIVTQKKLIERLEKEVSRLEDELCYYKETGKSKEVV